MRSSSPSLLLGRTAFTSSVVFFLLFSSPSADVSRATHVKRSLVFTGLNLGYVAMGTSEWRSVLKRGGLDEKRNPARSYELFIGREDMTSGGRDWS